MFCYTLLYVHSSIAIILMGKRELVALLNLCSWCLVMVEPLFLAVPQGCLQFVIVSFPDHSHLLFFQSIISGCKALSHASSDRIICFKLKWRLNPSVHRAKGDRLVRTRELPVCDNAFALSLPECTYQDWSYSVHIQKQRNIAVFIFCVGNFRDSFVYFQGWKDSS